MHSFLVSPQVAFRRRMINALNLTRFDITIRAVLSLMCALLWFADFVLFLKILSQPLQRDSTSVWTPRLWSYKAYLVMNCIPQTLQTNSPTILMKYVAFLFLLGRPADTDWPVITVGFDFEKPRNNSQNGSKNPPHATHFFGQKYTVWWGGGKL